MADIAAASPGRRGYRTFVPPPEGCVGWGTSTPSVPPASPSIGGRGSVSATPSGTKPQPKGKAATASPRGKTAGKAALQPPPQEIGLARSVWEVRQDFAPPHAGPVQDKSHLQAAAAREVDQLQRFDPRLQDALKEDEGVLEDAAFGQDAQDAFKVYCSALAAFDPGPRLRKFAFQAVISDDDQTLKQMLDSGEVAWDTTNAGGQTLLDVAHERQKDKCREVLMLKSKKQEASAAAAKAKAKAQAVPTRSSVA
mmetsp:Transcript_63990/g.180522  ORF Transcript_63990/g.180522 Transcript_63990/m.180522 type:complete len:253 (+) Transcript_63990:53-811(+)